MSTFNYPEAIEAPCPVQPMVNFNVIVVLVGDVPLHTRRCG